MSTALFCRMQCSMTWTTHMMTSHSARWHHGHVIITWFMSVNECRAQWRVPALIHTPETNWALVKWINAGLSLGKVDRCGLSLGKVDRCGLKWIHVDCGSYAAQLQDAVEVALVFLHLLPEADGLFHLLRVHVFGPPPLDVVYPTALRLKALRVHLQTQTPSVLLVDALSLKTNISVHIRKDSGESRLPVWI